MLNEIVQSTIHQKNDDELSFFFSEILKISERNSDHTNEFNELISKLFVSDEIQKQHWLPIITLKLLMEF